MHGNTLFKDFTVKLAIQYSVEGGAFGTKMGFLVELPGNDERPGNIYFFSLERRKNNTSIFVYSSNKEMTGYMAELKDDKLKQKKIEIILTAKPSRMGNFKSLFGE